MIGWKNDQRSFSRRPKGSNETMKALVTGGAGFIGSWLVGGLIEKGFEVVILDNLSTGKRENLNDKAKFYEIDISDKEVCGIFEKEKIDYVFHLAAQINVRESIKNPVDDAKINILASLNLLNCCVKNNVKKFIFSSTGGAIYGEDCEIPTSEKEKELPLSPYGIAKLSIENYLRFYKKVFGLDYVVLRYANVYGPRQNFKGEAGVIALFINNVLEGKEIVINGSGNQTRDYVYVKDVVKANLLALDLNGTFNVGTGIETNVNELLKKIKELMEINIDPKHGEEISGELQRSCLDITSLKEKGWEIECGLEKGLKETVEFFKK